VFNGAVVICCWLVSARRLVGTAPGYTVTQDHVRQNQFPCWSGIGKGTVHACVNFVVFVNIRRVDIARVLAHPFYTEGLTWRLKR
jgi:hypothetical protein